MPSTLKDWPFQEAKHLEKISKDGATSSHLLAALQAVDAGFDPCNV